ncbi:MAG: DUF2213 domain-containing protein [Nitrosopumilaceae archaeon]|jgi:hypothetical protein
MPLPKPKKGETQKEFMSRCMGDPIMVKEFPDQKQRSAICATEYNKRDKADVNFKSDQIRIDYISSDTNKEWITEKFELTSEGYLKGKAVITNVGVFPYQLKDGTVFWELRPPEEVFDQDSLDSFKMLPLTNEHPRERITIDNIKQYQVGYSGDRIDHDEYHVTTPLIFTDRETIMDIQEGKRAISNGYTCDVEETPGVWMGIPYDGIQRNIRGNHIALVDRGRAGDAAILRLDSAENIGIQTDENKIKGVEPMAQLKKFKIDGVEYEAEPEVIRALNTSEKKVDNLEKEIEQLKKDKLTLEGEKDQKEDELTELKKQLKESEENQNNDEDIENAVQQRLVIWDAAKRADVEIRKDSKEMDLKKEIIVKLFPNSKEKIDKAKEAYINARFDAALEYLEGQENEDSEDVEDIRVDSISHVSNKKLEHNSDAAYDKMVNRMTSAWEREVN